MTKRTNPFADDFIPQSKIHFGTKQFNKNEDRLKKVYEKTLEMLYKGANKSSGSQDSQLSPLPCRDKMKQLFIGKDGALSHTGLVRDKLKLTKRCACGLLGGLQCAYCEKALCSGCTCLCMNCSQHYCTHCSVLGSDDEEVCVSCYS